ncbi:MAG: serine/threonine-protein kinase [Verrucomicrobiales bacterium]|nr:serine/threonine-protein kinase [Verrucomicrobiales bacterium]
MEICEDCGSTIPGDAPLGLCPGCLLSGAPAVADEVEEAVDELIPGYRLVRQIGEGGFALVYEAEQLEPVRRYVALKILKPDVSSPQVLARFDAERQALAIMDHPNIASVYDAGETAEGDPWFAMEYVAGASITEFSTEKVLDVDTLLEIFRSVCEAVQHAHLKGVLHRDIKPSNILIAEIDGRPVPKVIDFGIARALDVSLTGHVLFTEFHQIVGTPAYMSPEQAALDNTPLDGRCDIYSLGILFYETLTGVQPFKNERDGKSGISELLRRVREEEPPPMSRFVPALRGETEWVIARAMEKDPEDRYDSAGALARELDRILHHRPVEAAAPSNWYRIRKFAQRHQTTVIAGTLVFAILLAAATVSTLQFLKATKLSEDLQIREIELSRQFRDSDYKLGLQMAARRRPADAIAYFCRSLRTDPNHHASASCLLSLLATQKFTKNVYAAMDYPEGVSSGRMPLVFDDGDDVLSLIPESGSLARWNVKERHYESFPTGFDEPVFSLLPGGSIRQFLLSSHRKVELRSVDNPGETLFRYEAESPIVSIASSGDSSAVVGGCEDGTAFLWSVRTGQLVGQRKLSDSPVTAVVATREGGLTGYGTASGEVGVWGVDFGFQSRDAESHRSRITALALSESGTHFASGDEAGQVYLWRTRQMLKVGGPLYHGDAVRVMNMNSSYRRLMSGSDDGFARLWDLNTGAFLPPAQHHRSPVVFGAPTSDAGAFITAGESGSVRIWNASDGSGETFPGTSQSSAVAMSSSRGYFATMSDKRRRLAVYEIDRDPAWVWRVSPGRKIDSTEMFGELSPQKMSDESGNVVVKQVSRSVLRSEGEFGSFSIRSIQAIASWTMRRDGSQVAILSKEGRLVMWDPRSGEELTPSIRLNSAELRGVRFTDRDTQIDLLFADDTLGRFEIPPPELRIPPWFLVFAEKMGGRRLAADGSIENLVEDSLQALAEVIPEEGMPSENRDGIAFRYASWLLSGNDVRCPGPTESMTKEEYVEQLIDTGEEALVQEALRLDRGNARGVSFLKNKLRSQQP